MRLSEDRLISQYKALTKAVKKNNSLILTQIAHSGFKRYNNELKIYPEIDSMSVEDIEEIVDLFIKAAMRDYLFLADSSSYGIDWIRNFINTEMQFSILKN